MNHDYFMSEALKLAHKAFDENEFPVGAVLTIDDVIIGSGYNKNESGGMRAAHAETSIIIENSAKLKNAQKEKKKISLYTTLEPCLMCMGTAVLHRIHKIVYACPDPHGGATFLKPHNLNASGFYQRKWPQIVRNISCKESRDLLVTYMQGRSGWENVLASFEKMNF